MDFQAYDFSYIPIETLSVVYEQFLHTPQQPGGKSKARVTGAYYTPIPLVNFMLSELETRRPLRKGTRAFDPACGSGAFLVQCYRRMIERAFPPSADSRPRPAELRELLTRHVFGVDVDEDACSVTELSLILTLLDYVHPPDLENLPQFQLPALRNQNIFCGNFFQDGGTWQEKLERKKAGWIIGNPPWKKLNPVKLTRDDAPAWNWMQANRSQKPVGRYQVAQAFAWEVARYLDGDGEIGLLLPAMTLFEDPSREVRSRFFQHMQVHSIANFSNLAEVLFAGRSRVPAAAFFYHPREGREVSSPESESIRTYSPLVANQEATRPVAQSKRNETWSLVINAGEVRDVPLAHVVDGNGLPWKLATWGSHLDRRLLEKLARRFPSLKDLEADGRVVASQGLELRRKGEGDVEYVEEVIGKDRLNVTPLKRLRKFFVFPSEAVEPNPPELCWARKGRVQLPLSVCRPPHVIVSAARNFAIYTEDYLLVPPRQIGISSPPQDQDFLKALSLYLSSDFAFYHQFLMSTQFGVKRDVATLRALRAIPVPSFSPPQAGLGEWVHLHGRLVKCSLQELEAAEDADTPLFAAQPPSEEKGELLEQLNELVYESLGLTRRDRALVRDLVNVRLELRDGMLGEPATGQPGRAQIRSYARRVKGELDAFVGEELKKRHKVEVVYDRLSGMVAVDLTANLEQARTITVAEADEATVAELEKTRRRLRRERAQWVYFDRNLRIYEGTRTFILKPMQRFHWTESQAMFDAAEIIAETLAGAGEAR
ncbi:MAG: N-6 DNA methylase [Planctomycetota bacterium]